MSLLLSFWEAQHTYTTSLRVLLLLFYYRSSLTLYHGQHNFPQNITHYHRAINHERMSDASSPLSPFLVSLSSPGDDVKLIKNYDFPLWMGIRCCRLSLLVRRRKIMKSVHYSGNNTKWSKYFFAATSRVQTSHRQPQSGQTTSTVDWCRKNGQAYCTTKVAGELEGSSRKLQTQERRNEKGQD